MSEIKVYNIYSCRSKGNKNNVSEEFRKKSLLDPLETIPTLNEYIERYVATGALPPFNNQEIEDCENEDFNIMDLKGADIEDFKDYRDAVLNEVERMKKINKNVDISKKEKNKEKETSEASDVKQNEASE